MTTTVEGSAEADGRAVGSHSVAAKLFHWGFALVFLYALTKQIDEVEELEDAALLQFELFFASFLLVLLLVRFAYMQLTRPSILPSTTPERERLLARAVHLGMYASIAMIALTGLTIGGLYYAGTKSGALMDVALVLHELAVIATYWLIAGHVIAAVYHRRKADGVWNSMVPVWKEPGTD